MSPVTGPPRCKTQPAPEPPAFQVQAACGKGHYFSPKRFAGTTVAKLARVQAMVSSVSCRSPSPDPHAKTAAHNHPPCCPRNARVQQRSGQEKAHRERWAELRGRFDYCGVTGAGAGMAGLLAGGVEGVVRSTPGVLCVRDGPVASRGHRKIARAIIAAMAIPPIRNPVPSPGPTGSPTRGTIHTIGVVLIHHEFPYVSALRGKLGLSRMVSYVS